MVILLLALLVLGPDKLPEYTRKAGRYINEFRRMTSGFQEEFRSAIDLGDTLSPTPEKPAEAPTSDGRRRCPRPHHRGPPAPAAGPRARLGDRHPSPLAPAPPAEHRPSARARRARRRGAGRPPRSPPRSPRRRAPAPS